MCCILLEDSIKQVRNVLYYLKKIWIMINCNLKVVNVVNDNNPYNVNYIPFSISTIKLLIQNNENYEVKIIIKPARFQNDDEFYGGFDDDNKGLRIMWGGGEESGIKIKLQPYERKYTYFFVSHMENFNELLSYDLTLQIDKKNEGSNILNITEEIHIKLNPIQHTQLTHNIVHQKITQNSQITEINFDGNLVGYYYPRWYPELFAEIGGDINNYYHTEPLIKYISFRILKKDQKFGKDRMVLNFKDNEIAVIDGDMDGATYKIDAFRFNNALVIRIWFLWFSKNQFRNRNNLELLQQVEQKKGIADFFYNPELPDIERFDIIVSSDGKILAACTDFHWQEYWYEKRNNNENMTGLIAQVVYPIDETLSLLLNRVSIKNRYIDIINNLKMIISQNKIKNFNSQIIYCKGEELEMAVQEREKDSHIKGTNILRSHVPYIRNSDILSNMISYIVDKE